MSVDLSTRYLGLELKNPLAVASCSLTESAESLRRLEEAGAAAVVLPSLFEEQIEFEEVELSNVQDRGTESFAEALSYFPEPQEYRTGCDRYLELIGQAKQSLSIPVIASLNGVSRGGWIRYAQLIQEAGADALELNVYLIAADLAVSGQQIESQYLELVSAVRESISIPLSVKIGPYFSSPAHMASQLSEAGADGLVLFNRFFQPDIDLDDVSIAPKLVLSSRHELLLALRWIAILKGRVKASLALTGGVHGAKGLLKGLLVGADVAMVASVLYRKGPDEIGKILADLRGWMEKRGYDSIEQLKGSMSQRNCDDPAAFERGNYMKALIALSDVAP